MFMIGGRGMNELCMSTGRGLLHSCRPIMLMTSPLRRFPLQSLLLLINLSLSRNLDHLLPAAAPRLR